MTAGLPGAGIGGMFYILSAVGMPFHAAYRSIRARITGSPANPPVKWGSVVRQFAIGIGILGALWVTGWLIARGITAYPHTLGAMSPAAPGHRVPNILRIGALILSAGTLSFVLLAVQIARLFVGQSAGSASRRAGLVIVFFLFAAPAALAQNGVVALHLRAAETAYDAGLSDIARTEYSAVLAVDPVNSRALYRMGELSRDNKALAVAMFRRYVAVVPSDPWGHMALGDALARHGKFKEAVREYDAASLLAPGERDVVIGRARLLAAAGRTDDAIVALESWTRAHPQDAAALRDLGDQRRRAGRFREAADAYRLAQARDPQPRIATRLESVEASSAPALEVATTGTADSDDNRVYGVGALGSVAVGDRARFGVGGGWRRLTGIFSANVATALGTVYARPLASLRFEASGGAAFTSSDDVVLLRQSTSETIGIGSARAVWKHPGGGMLDLRATRALLDASGELVLNRVVRNEVAVRGDIPLISRIRFRGGAKTATYDAVNESSKRDVLAVGLAASVTDAAEVSGIFQELRFDHPTTSGYFSPRLAQLAELGTYAEFESASGSVLALDAGAGAQRVSPFGVATASWKPAFRLFAQLTVPVRPGSELRAEVDSYDSAFGNAAVTSTNWRYISGSLSLRLALR